MSNQEENQNVQNPFIEVLLKNGLGKIIGWLAVLMPPLLLYWLTTIYSTSYIYSIYEIYSICGVCWLIFIIGFVLLISVILIFVLSWILSFIGRPLTKDAILIKYASFAGKLSGPIENILWFFTIAFGYSLVYAYAPLKPIIMKAYSLFHVITFIDYYQLTELCNSYVSWAINILMQ